MPAMRSRMSSSSSMIRMSRAMLGLLDRHSGRLLCLCLFGWRCLGGSGHCRSRCLFQWLLRRRQREREGETGADAAVRIRLSVDQVDNAAMLLDDALDNREPE